MYFSKQNHFYETSLFSTLRGVNIVFLYLILRRKIKNKNTDLWFIVCKLLELYCVSQDIY